MSKTGVAGIVVIIIILLSTLSAQSAILHVGGSWSPTYGAIQSAIDAAQPGDEVWVAGGTTYYENVHLKANVSLYGGFVGNETALDQRPPFFRELPDPYQTTIDGGGVDSVIIVEPGGTVENTVIDGFTIQHGMSTTGDYPGAGMGPYTMGGGIRVASSARATVCNNTITENVAEFGGGIGLGGVHSQSSSLAATHNRIVDNTAYCYGGGLGQGIWAASNVAGNLLDGNTAGDVNYLGSGGAIFGAYGYLGIYNNTIVRNSADYCGAIEVFADSGNPIMACAFNNIFAFNTSAEGGGVVFVNWPGDCFNNLFFGNTGDDNLPPGTIRANPLFVDDVGPDYDYHIKPESPCIDAGGCCTGCYAPWWSFPVTLTDVDGDYRIQGHAIDIGMDEYRRPDTLTSIDTAKRAADDTPDAPQWVELVDRVVTATGLYGQTYPFKAYIEEDDRSIGIRLLPVGCGTTALTAGQRMIITGVMKTNDQGERYIEAAMTVPTGPGSVEPVPMTNPEVGGADWFFDPLNGAGQKGIAEATGPNNIGLLVQISGEVTCGCNDPYCWGWQLPIYIDDGSQLRDGTQSLRPGGQPHIGVAVASAGLPPGVTRGRRLQVTGISSCFKDEGGNLRRLILPTNVVFLPTDTTTIAYGTTGYPETTVNLYASLIDDTGANVTLNKTFCFKIDGVDVGCWTADGSTPGLPYTITLSMCSGDHEITASFAGDTDFNPSSDSAILRVIPMYATLAADDVSGHPGDTIALKVTMIKSGSSIPLGGKTICFTVDGQSTGCGVTNSEGVANANYHIPSDKPLGTYSILASFAEDCNYYAATDGAVLTVRLPAIVITHNPPTNVTTTSVTIAWTTKDEETGLDLPTTGTVYYGANLNCDSNQINVSDAGNAHSVTIDGLQFCAVYCYTIVARSEGYPDKTLGPIYFEPKHPINISNARAEDITSTQATIRWTTDVSATTEVKYGPTPNCTQNSVTDNQSNRVYVHSVTLTNLIPDTDYCYCVRSTVPQYGGTSLLLSVQPTSEPCYAPAEQCGLSFHTPPVAGADFSNIGAAKAASSESHSVHIAELNGREFYAVITKIVTHEELQGDPPVPTVVQDGYYVQDIGPAGRLFSGVEIITSDTKGGAVVEGARITSIIGIMDEGTCSRTISYPTVTISGTAGIRIPTVRQDAIAGGCFGGGIDTTSMMVRILGHVGSASFTGGGEPYFYMDDGCGLTDGRGESTGILVVLPIDSQIIPVVDDYVMVEGITAYETTEYGDNARTIRYPTVTILGNGIPWGVPPSP